MSGEGNSTNPFDQSDVTDTPQQPKENEKDHRSHWVKDEDALNCHICRLPFHFSKWKHHCRACGKVFCADCSSSRIRLEEMGYTEKVRVCDDCAFKKTSNKTQLLAEDLDEKDAINARLKSDLEEKSRLISRFRTFLLHIEGEVLASQVSPAFETAGDSLNDLMEVGEEGLKCMVHGLKLKEQDLQMMHDKIRLLGAEKDAREHEVTDLRARLQRLQDEVAILDRARAERDALRNNCEEQRIRLAEQKNYLEGVQQRCLNLENELKKRREQLPPGSTLLWGSEGPRSRSTDQYPTANSAGGRVAPSESYAFSYTVASGLEDALHVDRRPWRCCRRRRRPLCSIM